MTLIRNFNFNSGQIAADAGGRVRSSQLTTLHDGKILNADNALLFENQGTGTNTYSNNKYNMSVTAGQWFIKQTRRFFPYFSGKSQLIECTFDNFQAEANTTKRVGYFSSNAVSPFDTTYDGFWLENDGTTIRLKAARAGTETVNVPWTSWDNYSLISSYNWSNFTVMAFDFLWLGGAVLRIFLKTDKGFVLAHTVNYSGTTTDTITLSPNQPVRYEIRSSTGTGSLRYVCSQISTEGSINESGRIGSIFNGTTGVIYNTIGTIYPVKAIRKKSAFRDVSVKITNSSLFINSADQALVTLEINPTLSATLTYSDVTNRAIQEANGNGTITVTTRGTVLYSQVLTQNSTPILNLNEDYLSFLGQTLNNTLDEIVLCITPITATVTAFGNINYKEY